MGRGSVAVVVLCANLFILAPLASPQSNALILPRNLGELVSESQVVVQGWVTTVTLTPHPQLRNLMTVVVTLQVEDTLKGVPEKTFTFQQAVIDRNDQRQKMGYRAGQHVLLILMKPSPYGLTSPAGMEQGHFRIERSGGGALAATNGLGNSGLFRGLASQLKTRGLSMPPEIQEVMAKPEGGSIPLQPLKDLIRAIAGTGPTK